MILFVVVMRSTDWEFLISSPNVKEHATLSAGARVDHGVSFETKERHVNRAADRGCVSRLVLLLHSLIDGIFLGLSHVLGQYLSSRNRRIRLQSTPNKSQKTDASNRVVQE